MNTLLVGVFMKPVLFGLALVIAAQATPVFARELVCNDGAMVVRENPIPKKDRDFPDADLIATIYDHGVVNHLKHTFGYSGDGGYGRTAYLFEANSPVLNIYFYGYEEPRSLDEQELGTSGKFSNAILRKEGPGVRVILVGAGRSADWYFEHCRITR